MSQKSGQKTIIVTGGLGLVGRGIAQFLLGLGHKVVIGDIANIVEADIGLPDVIYQKMDITDKQSLLDGIEEISKKCNQIDVLINNAYPRNANYGRNFFEVEYQDFCENVSLHLGGYFLTCQVFAEYFMKLKCGSIINMSSIYGVNAPRFELYEGTTMTVPVEYAAIKSAVIHLTRYMAKYLGGNNIRVNCVSPGGVFDNQDPAFVSRYNKQCSLGGMLNPKDIASVVGFLISDDSYFINGQNIVVDGGWTL